MLSYIHWKVVILGEVTGVAPSEVVILGSGTVAEQAARTAMSMGAVVRVFDDSIYKLMNLKARLGQHISTSVFHPKALRKALKTAEVVLGAMPMNEVPNVIVPEDMVEGMKENSVIIDLNIIQGGCFETSRITTLKNPTYKMHGVIHCCVPNLESRWHEPLLSQPATFSRRFCLVLDNPVELTNTSRGTGGFVRVFTC